MIRRLESIAITILWLGLRGNPAFAQAPAGSILHVEIVNSTLYRRGYCSIANQGKDPTKLPTSTITPFATAVGVGDIVLVNGQPVKGVALQYFQGGSLSSTFTPGTKIADINSAPSGGSWDLTFLNPDGTLIGSIHIDGNAGGPPPPGAPKEIAGASLMVTGGTGPFFGARGYWQPTQDSVSGDRQTTDCEDPAYRRINADPGGNKRHGILYLVALEAPQVVITPNGPAVVHASDGSLVTPAKPARAGEILTLFASGLGPTKPGVDPGQPFPASPPQIVNSPVQVLVNGNPGDVLYAGTYPGAVDGYQVNFRVPDGTALGQASLQVAAAWITGSSVKIPVQ
jgi:hypothetical protein